MLFVNCSMSTEALDNYGFSCVKVDYHLPPVSGSHLLCAVSHEEYRTR